MRKFKYVGDPRYRGEGPKTVTVYGVTFPKGETVGIHDPVLIAKCENNNHFVEVKAGRPAKGAQVTDDDQG